MDTPTQEIIREWVNRPSNSPLALIDGGQLSEAVRPRNGESEQVPLSRRHRRVVIVPEVPELIKLLVTLRAEPLGEVINVGPSNKRYRQFELPESMRFTGGRYSRAGEFTTDDGEDAHGWRPGTIYAPDNTLLFTVNELSNSLSFTVGRTWLQVSDLLATNTDTSVLPDEVIFAQGTLDSFPMGETWEKVLNGIDQEGQMPHAIVARGQFLSTIKAEHDQWERATKALPGMDEVRLNHAYEVFIEGKFREFVAELREPLVDFDSRRGDVFAQMLTDQRIAATHPGGQNRPENGQAEQPVTVSASLDSR